MTINELCADAHQLAVEKGFYDKYRSLPELLMLIVSELGEACEALRKQKKAHKDSFFNATSGGNDSPHIFETYIKDSFEDELADAVIRICDLAKSQNIDLEWHIQEKMKYNKTRPIRHGKEF